MHIQKTQIVRDVRNAIKIARCAASGFVALQYKAIGRDNRPRWRDVQSGTFPDAPFFICAVFGSRKHLPLPFLTGQARLGLLSRISFALCAEALRPAREACVTYQRNYINRPTLALRLALERSKTLRPT